MGNFRGTGTDRPGCNPSVLKIASHFSLNRVNKPLPAAICVIELWDMPAIAGIIDKSTWQKRR
tara:strand:+ start:168 stop:356 length:189 start_codon:yes stop_codon:yes gene_type:complete